YELRLVSGCELEGERLRACGARAALRYLFCPLLCRRRNAPACIFQGHLRVVDKRCRACVVGCFFVNDARGRGGHVRAEYARRDWAIEHGRVAMEGILYDSGFVER